MTQIVWIKLRDDEPVELGDISSAGDPNRIHDQVDNDPNFGMFFANSWNIGQAAAITRPFASVGTEEPNWYRPIAFMCNHKFVEGAMRPHQTGERNIDLNL